MIHIWHHIDLFQKTLFSFDQKNLNWISSIKLTLDWSDWVITVVKSWWFVTIVLDQERTLALIFWTAMDCVDYQQGH